MVDLSIVMLVYQRVSPAISTLLVGGLEHGFYCSISWGQESQVTNSMIFRRGRSTHQPACISNYSDVKTSVYQPGWLWPIDIWIIVRFAPCSQRVHDITPQHTAGHMSQEEFDALGYPSIPSHWTKEWMLEQPLDSPWGWKTWELLGGFWMVVKGCLRS